MKTLLFISHAPSENTTRLADRCETAMKEWTDTLQIIRKPSPEVVADDVLGCDGVLISTTENIGYMAGLTKDAFDRCCLLYTSPSPRDQRGSRMPSSA